MNQHPRGVDIFNLESLLSESELQIRDTVRSFATERVLPKVREYWRRSTFPVEFVKEMGALGLLGGHLDFGNSPRIGPLAYGLCMLELERVDAGLRSFASVQGALVMNTILSKGSEEQKERWLGPLSRGDAIGAFALTEPDHGSDPRNMSTKATKSGNSWIIHGSKQWVTNGTIADVVLVFAKTTDGIGAFLVPKGKKKFTATDIPGKHCMRMSVTSDLSFDEVVVPAGARLPGIATLKDCLKKLNAGRTAIAWGAIGAAEACFEETLAYVSSRVQFNKPLASFQLVQEKLADMAGHITRSQLLCYHLARLEASDKVSQLHVSMAKRDNVRSALYVAQTCRKLLGANGIADDYVAFRHYANLDAQSTIDGTDHVHSLIMGQSLTGYPAFC